MAKFTAVGRKGDARVTITVDAANNKDAATQLLKQGIIPIDIKPFKEKSQLSKVLNIRIGGNKVTRDELLLFTQQMYTLVKSGVPIIKALNRLSETTRSPFFTEVLRNTAQNISEGYSLADSLRRYPKAFSTVFVNLIEAGENSGRLEEAFHRLTDFILFESTNAKRVKSATRYPMFVLIVMVAAIGVINFFVVPAFSALFSKFEAELPLPTRILIGFSNFTSEHGLLIIISFIALWIAIYMALKTQAFRYQWDRYKLKVPVMGKIFERILLARFTRVFTMMTSSGMPITNGITLVANTLSNTYMRDNILKMRVDVENGQTLTNAAQRTKLFTPLIIQMLSTGEETGEIDNMLSEIADHYEREVEFDLSRLNELIEPILLGILGVIVMILVLAVYLPIWTMVDFIKR